MCMGSGRWFVNIGYSPSEKEDGLFRKNFVSNEGNSQASNSMFIIYNFYVLQNKIQIFLETGPFV